MPHFDLLTRETVPWHALVTAAEAADRRCLDEPLARYVVGLLVRYVGRPDLLGQLAAAEFVGPALAGGRRCEDFQELGDRCLLLAGLFPDLILGAGVPIAYYVRLGQSAYRRMAGSGDPVFEQLRAGFVDVMDVLQGVRELDDGGPLLSLLSLHDLWQETGSRHAWRLLTRGRETLPVAASAAIH